ncbi:MAG: ATPase [Armatimonadota bacterium]|nr:MAG: ATPase [Armatimonadota bacterium]
MDSLELIRQLEDLVDRETRWHVFRRVWGVDEEKFFTLLNKLRASLPEDLKKASRIAKESDRILAEAHEQAASILAEAQEQAALLVSNDEISKQAVKQSEEIVQRAREEADETRRQVNDYAKRVLQNLEGYTSKLLATIERGRLRLEEQAPLDEVAAEDGGGEQ